MVMITEPSARLVIATRPGGTWRKLARLVENAPWSKLARLPATVKVDMRTGWSALPGASGMGGVGGGGGHDGIGDRGGGVTGIGDGGVV